MVDMLNGVENGPEPLTSFQKAFDERKKVYSLSEVNELFEKNKNSINFDLSQIASCSIS